MPRRFLLFAIVVALGISWYLALPDRARPLPEAPAEIPDPVRGAIHVHSDRSDGTGTREEIATAAARAGLRFVVFTDHGDGTREAAPPQYVQDVLCIDSVEISTEAGHLLALGLPKAPYPLGGEPRDVVEDVARLGGFSIAAHPGSEKAELRWVEWSEPIDGLEWLNGDSEWRDESAWSLARALLTYPARKPEALAALLDRPNAVLARWDELTRSRRAVAVAGADAHARLGLRSFGEPYENGPSLPVPGYEQVFRTFSIALPALTLTEDAAADARAVIDAIRRGHVYSIVDAVGGAAALSFTATSGAAKVTGGDALMPSGPTTLRVDAQAPDDARIELLKDGVPVASANGPTLEHVTDVAAAYRVEIALPDAPGRPPVPWIVSNPIYVGRFAGEERLSAPRPQASEFVTRYDNGTAGEWNVEASPDSTAAFDIAPAVGGTQLSFRYALGGTASASPFAALVMPAGPDISGYDRLMFRAHADRPMRLSVQVREPGGSDGQRWHRSVYLDTTSREIAIDFDDLKSRGFTSRPSPDMSNVQSVLFVVDTLNTELGSNGRVWIDEVRYAR